jgi:hypothetical protein
MRGYETIMAIHRARVTAARERVAMQAVATQQAEAEGRINNRSGTEPRCCLETVA